MAEDSPRVDALIESVMKRFPGVGGSSHARYFEAVHQELAPLARELEMQTRQLSRWRLAFLKQRDAAMRAHAVCYEAMLANPDVPTLGDDGTLHDAIHDILRVDGPAGDYGFGFGPGLGDCPACYGSGEVRDADDNGQLCEVCEATGWIAKRAHEADDE